MPTSIHPAIVALLLSLLAACGGLVDPPDPAPHVTGGEVRLRLDVRDRMTGAGDGAIEQPRFTIGGTVVGLLGSGLVLQATGGDTVELDRDGRFELPSLWPSGAEYEITVRSQPSHPQQECFVENGRGRIAGADVTNLEVTCKTRMYAVSVNVGGLVGSGLMLQNNGADDLVVSADGDATFPQLVASGTPYVVTVLSQPVSPAQTCTVLADPGTIATADVADIPIRCTTNSYAIGGTVIGLADGPSTSGAGTTAMLVLQNNGDDALVIAANGAFQMPAMVASGTEYEITVAQNPADPAQSCFVTNGAGVVGGADIADVVIECITNEAPSGSSTSGVVAGSGGVTP